MLSMAQAPPPGLEARVRIMASAIVVAIRCAIASAPPPTTSSLPVTADGSSIQQLLAATKEVWPAVLISKAREGGAAVRTRIVASRLEDDVAVRRRRAWLGLR